MDGKNQLKATWVIRPEVTWGDKTPVTCRDWHFAWVVGSSPNVMKTEIAPYAMIADIQWSEEKPKTCHVTYTEASWNFDRRLPYFLPYHLEAKIFEKWKNLDTLEHGEWAFPVWPSNRSLQGSVPTPYIFDDRVDFVDVANALFEVYSLSRDERKERGKVGREYMLNPISGMSLNSMADRIKQSIDTCISEFKPKDNFSITKV